MPITPANLTLSIAGGLASGGATGMAVPQVAAGLAAGIMIWLPQVVVTTVDAGAIGVGAGTIPFAMPPPLLIAGMLSGMPSSGITGIMSPAIATGIANGLALGFLQGLIITAHPSVGTGTGICKLVAPPALPSLQAGFLSSGITGIASIQVATAVSTGLLVAVNAFTLPTPIVGGAGPSPSSGVGVGTIV